MTIDTKTSDLAGKQAETLLETGTPELGWKNDSRGRRLSSITLYNYGHIQWYEKALPMALGFSVINAKRCTWES